MLVYRTAGGGGWKDRLDRETERVSRDVSFGLVSREKATTGYGVVFKGDTLEVDEAATAKERDRQRTERGPVENFDYGPPLEELLANCLAETGMQPPKLATPLRWSPLQDGAEALALVRIKDNLPAPTK